MDTLDLHGVLHYEAQKIVEDFILKHEYPIKIITGNSLIMRSIVKEVAHLHDLDMDVESDWNLGAFIIKS